MTAEDAKRLNQQFIEESVRKAYSNQDIDSRIEATAKKGGVGISIDIKSFDWRIKARYFEIIKAEYESRGFKVKRNQWSDPRDNDSGDEISISWAS